MNKIDVLLGLQWGDEGKGAVVDRLTPDYDVIARFQGGPNAGHTLVIDGNTMILHQIPSGINHEHCMNLIGSNQVVNLIQLKNEILELAKKGIPLEEIKKRLFISRRANLIIPSHVLWDKAKELFKGKSKIGSTQQGISQTYIDKYGRDGLKFADIFAPNFKKKFIALDAFHKNMISLYDHHELVRANPKEKRKSLAQLNQEFLEAVEFIRQFESHIVDGEKWLWSKMDADKKVLAEGAQGTLLDIDWGTYPFVTSSNTITAGVCTGLGVSPKDIGTVIGIIKAYTTRVGAGPFPTKFTDERAQRIQKNGNEFGATTGRPRDCGAPDIPLLRYAVRINGVDKIVLTKGDVLNNELFVSIGIEYKLYDGNIIDYVPNDLNDIKSVIYDECPGWSELSKTNLHLNFLNYCNVIAQELKVPVWQVSLGPDRNDAVYL